MTRNFILALALALMLAVPGWAGRNYDGVDDTLDCGSAASLDNIKAGGGITISAWIFPETQGESNVGAYVSKVTSAPVGWSFRNIATFAPRFVHTTTGVALVRAGNNNTIVANVWQHVLMTWDGSTTATNIHIYKDGTEVGYQTTTNGDPLHSDAAANLIIGNNESTTTTFDGSIAEVGIWAVILSAGEITSLSDGASPATIRTASLRLYSPGWGVASPEPDLSGNANHCTVTGAVLANHSPTGPMVEE